MSKDRDELVAAARAVRRNAHAPYSRYFVGAAVKTASGRVFTGCNVENASYGATLCAERNAIAQMVAAGEGGPVACAVVTEGKNPGSPCGVCRQVLVEFAADMDVHLASADETVPVRTVRLAALLPEAFTPASLQTKAGGPGPKGGHEPG